MITCPKCLTVGRCFHVGRSGSNRVQCKQCKHQFQIAAPEWLKPESLHWKEVVRVDKDEDE